MSAFLKLRLDFRHIDATVAPSAIVPEIMVVAVNVGGTSIPQVLNLSRSRPSTRRHIDKEIYEFMYPIEEDFSYDPGKIVGMNLIDLKTIDRSFNYYRPCGRIYIDQVSIETEGYSYSNFECKIEGMEV